MTANFFDKNISIFGLIQIKIYNFKNMLDFNANTVNGNPDYKNYKPFKPCYAKKEK